MKKKILTGFSLVPMRQVKAGTILICDDGFTCNPACASRMVFRDRDTKGSMKSVPRHARSRLYIRCKDGRHYLDGQVSATGTHYVGFWLSPKQRY